MTPVEPGVLGSVDVASAVALRPSRSGGTVEVLATAIRGADRAMKLGEALARRADIQKQVEQLRRRLLASVLIQEGVEPPEDAQILLDEFGQLADELERLVVTINYTNLKTIVHDAATLTDALARRDSLTLRQGLLRAAADAAAARESRFLRSELRLIPTVDVAELRTRINELGRERRELDTLIQETNWTTDLLD